MDECGGATPFEKEYSKTYNLGNSAAYYASYIHSVGIVDYLHPLRLLEKVHKSYAHVTQHFPMKVISLQQYKTTLLN